MGVCLRIYLQSFLIDNSITPFRPESTAPDGLRFSCEIDGTAEIGALLAAAVVAVEEELLLLEERAAAPASVERLSFTERMSVSEIEGALLLFFATAAFGAIGASLVLLLLRLALVEGVAREKDSLPLGTAGGGGGAAGADAGGFGGGGGGGAAVTATIEADVSGICAAADDLAALPAGVLTVLLSCTCEWRE